MKLLYVNHLFKLPDDFTGDYLDALEELVKYRKEQKGKEVYLNITKRETNSLNSFYHKSINRLLKIFMDKVLPIEKRSFGLCALYQLIFDGKCVWEYKQKIEVKSAIENKTEWKTKIWVKSPKCEEFQLDELKSTEPFISVTHHFINEVMKKVDEANDSPKNS